MTHQPSPPLAKRVQDKLETYTKTDLKYLASGGFWLTVDQALGAGISFLLSIGFGHFVSPTVYGTYRYLLATFWTLAAFTYTGLPTALSQAVARGYEGALDRSVRLSLVGGLPLLVIGLCMSAYYFWAGNDLLGYGLLAIALLGPFMQPAHLFGSFLAGKKEFKAMTLLGIFFALAPALSLGAAMFFTQSPLVFFLVYLVATIVSGGVLYLVTKTSYQSSRETNADLPSLAKHFSLMNLLSTLAAQLDKIIVFHYLGAIELAIYTFAIALPEQIKGLFGAVPVLAFPKFATRPTGHIRGNFWRRLWMFAGLLALSSIAYAIIAPFVFHIFFPKYIDAIWYSQIFALSLVLTSVAVPTTLLQAKAAKRELYIFNTLSSLFQVAALLVGTITFGLIGTIAGRIAGRLFSLILSLILARSYLESTPLES